jgi:hypothetical protein
LARLLFGAVAAGIVLGVLASQMLFLGVATLIPWGVAGLVVGAICRDWRQAVAAGAAYGFVLDFSFIAFDYNGADPVVTKVPFFAMIGMVRALFGLALGLAGRWLAALGRAPSGGPAS